MFFRLRNDHFNDRLSFVKIEGKMFNLKRNYENEQIGSIIHKWLLSVMAAAFVVLIIVVSIVQVVYERIYYYNLLTGHIEDVIVDNSETLSSLFYEWTDLFRDNIERNRDILDNEYLELEVSDSALTISELNVVDKNGIIIYSSNPDYIGFDMHSGEQSKEFLCLLSGTNYYAQERLQKITYRDDIEMAYTGMAFSDGSGFIQMGVNQEDYYKIMTSVNTNEVKHRHIGLSGSAMLCNKNLEVVYSGHDRYNGRILDNSQILPDNEDEYKQTKANIFGTECYVVSSRYEGFYIITMIPVKEASMFGNINKLMMAVMTVVILICMYRVLSKLLNEHVVKNVEQINASLIKITGGDLDERLTVNDTIEFKGLSAGINAMVDRVREMISQAKAKIEEELQNAKIVQTSSLPSVFPPYPDRNEFEIYASMNAAKKVGGDFYDFFFVDSDHFVIVMADVSDKGIPAAMFMMQSKACIRAHAMTGKRPAEILAGANEELYRDNDSGMFVTVWLAIVEISTGRVIEGNAGHTYPAVLRNKSFGLEVYKHSLPLGMFSSRTYTDREFVLSPGDVIFVYTDGVTEAENADNEFFGDERLVEALNACKDESCEQMLESVRKAITDYTKDMPQSDDITMCAFRYLG